MAIVIPPILKEGDCNSFKFWFNHRIQHGMVYQNELFYRIKMVPPQDRALLYHQACKLAQHSSVVVTASREQYSLWLSLRSPLLHPHKR